MLINNAGIEGPDHKKIQEAATIQDLQKDFLKDWDLWNPTWQTNTAAIISVSGSFLHLLDEGNKKRGWKTGKKDKLERLSGDESDQRTSQIISVASISAFNRYITAGLAYTASKAGAVMLGKSLANLLAPFGIRSNIIAPGRELDHHDKLVAARTDVFVPGFPSDMTAGAPTVFPVSQIPHGKPGEYGDMAGLILYLVGKSGSYVNGNVSVLDGGRISVMPATY